MVGISPSWKRHRIILVFAAPSGQRTQTHAESRYLEAESIGATACGNARKHRTASVVVSASHRHVHLSGFRHDRPRGFAVLFGVDLGGEGGRVPQDDPGEFDSVLLPQPRGSVVAELVRMPLVLALPHIDLLDLCRR